MFSGGGHMSLHQSNQWYNLHSVLGRMASKSDSGTPRNSVSSLTSFKKIPLCVN